MVRQGVLDLMVQMMVSNSSFTPSCLQVLMFSLLPPPAPPVAEEPGTPWVPVPEDLAIQDEVVGALNKVGGLFFCDSLRCGAYGTFCYGIS